MRSKVGVEVAEPGSREWAEDFDKRLKTLEDSLKNLPCMTKMRERHSGRGEST